MSPDELTEADIERARKIAREFVSPDSPDWDDAEGDAFLGLTQAAEDFNPSLEVPFWAFAIVRVRGSVMDGLRSKGRALREVPLNPENSILEAPETSKPQDDLFENLKTALTPEQLNLLKLYYVEDLGKTEIAERLNLDRETVSNRLEAILHELRTAPNADELFS